MMKKQLQKLTDFFTGNALKLIVLVVILLGSIHTKLYAQVSADKAKAYYFSAVEQYDNRNYSKAIEYCQQVEDLLGSTNARVEALRLKSYFDKGNTKLAKESLDVFLTLEADDDLLKEISPYIVKIEDSEKERAAWDLAQNNNSKEAYESFLASYPNGSNVAKAKAAIKRIEKEEFERKHTTCLKCYGKGEISTSRTCWKCDGSGEMSGPARNCSNCGGSGKGEVKTDIWGSRVTYACKHCSWGKVYPKITCSDCKGEGEKTTTKTCTKCYGKGVILKSESEVFSIRYSKEERKAMAEKASFSEGLAVIELKSKKGYIDKEGNEAISFIYDDAENFKAGIALVKKKGKYGYIDKEGHEFIKTEYDELSSFDDDGFAWYQASNNGSNKNKYPYAYGVLNRKGESIGGFVSSNDEDKTRWYVYYRTIYYILENDNDYLSNNKYKSIDMEKLAIAELLANSIPKLSEYYEAAQLEMGRFYYYGRKNLTEDTSTALKYYARVQQSESILNKYDLEIIGDMYYNGTGISIDREKSLYYYKKMAASYSRPFEQVAKYIVNLIDLGRFSEAEEEIAKAEEQIKKEDRLSKKIHYYPTIFYSKACLYDKKGDRKEALKWYKKADKNGHLDTGNYERTVRRIEELK